LFPGSKVDQAASLVFANATTMPEQSASGTDVAQASSVSNQPVGGSIIKVNSIVPASNNLSASDKASLAAIDTPFSQFIKGLFNFQFFKPGQQAETDLTQGAAGVAKQVTGGSFSDYLPLLGVGLVAILFIFFGLKSLVSAPTE
jgi:hypothetical protein